MPPGKRRAPSAPGSPELGSGVVVSIPLIGMNLSGGVKSLCLLANRLAQDGCEVTCFKGAGASTPLRSEGRTEIFTTNDHLRELLEGVERREEIGAVFHAAALSDFRVDSVRGEDGAQVAVVVRRFRPERRERRGPVRGFLVRHRRRTFGVLDRSGEEQRQRSDQHGVWAR